MEILFKNAHTNVRNILTDDFYWNPNEHTLPFGDPNALNFINDFTEDRDDGSVNDPIEYIKEYFELGNELYELNAENIEKLNEGYVDQYSASYEEYLELRKDIIDYSDSDFSDETEALLDLELPQPFNSLYSSLDACIIGLAFYIAFEQGTIPIRLGRLAEIALTRESLGVMLKKIPIEFRNNRALELAIMKANLKLILDK